MNGTHSRNLLLTYKADHTIHGTNPEQRSDRQSEQRDTEWTFLDVSTKKYTHAIHLYPARMHPVIARKLISRYTRNRSDVVLDPFMGSGGVLLEAILHGNASVGIDINPFAVLLTTVNPEVLFGQ